jgi:hypothetical protein
MTIDPDVRGVARYFGVDARLIQAVVNAEGGGPHIITAVQCSIPAVQTREEALRVVCRSAVHAMSDFIQQGHDQSFVDFWAARWAPTGAANDPTHLNEHWSGNVFRGWRTT